MPFNSGNLKKYNDAIGLGSEIAAAMIVPVLIGYYIDQHFHISPWGILGGILFGFLGTFNAIYKVMIRGKKKDDQGDE
ncbi:MAG TPA: AtpZ/AtpI family protein [Balneolales bacterium]|nr:AtpZ/AtpI family protein [Balneolales bacterium]